MDRLTSMTAFIRASDLGSFAAAAAAMDMSPQMIAKHVTALEARLGSRLLNRTTRRQSLTEIGRAYYDRCKIVLAEVDAADSLAQSARAIPRGLLRVNAPVTFGTQRLVPFIAAYMRRHPEVEIDLVLTDRFVDLVDEGYEIAFRVGALADSSLMSRALARFRTAACASPAYLAERGTPATPSDLAQHSCLIRTATAEWHFVKDGRPHPVRVQTRLRLNEARAMLPAALAGLGIVLISEDLVRDGLADGRLVRVLADYETPSLPMQLVFLTDRHQTPKLRSFIDAAVEAFG